ncbi:MAG: NPCBM-associated, NEW3 domain of alpha-galactosidase [Methanosaeta sp. PtaU1.Bin060]|nr:MAG: NPCBM-associated, NEW3 domain of alpha-galactosidase [Methanosaeta sp. PtaU1.Bin060]
MRFKLALLCFSFLTLMTLVVQAQNTYIPYELGGDNYYTMYGSPAISASVAGTDEFDRGDTVTLFVDLTNYGRILGFKEDLTPDNPKEFALAAAELQEEYKKTTALGITASLVSSSPQVDVKSGDQVVQALKSGDKTQSPLKFTLKIGEHAPAGEYPLDLNLSYDYQDNVRVYASGLSTSAGTPTLVNFRTSYVYQKANQSVPISIMVKKQADFEITTAKGIFSVGGKKAPVEVTYRNIGEDPVRDAVARLSIFKPFSSTDDQAFIGTLEPGEERTVLFRIDIDSDATPKDYGINSEIKYTDVDGETVISQSMKIPVKVKAASASLLLPAIVILVILAAAGGYMYRRRQKKA